MPIGARAPRGPPKVSHLRGPAPGKNIVLVALRRATYASHFDVDDAFCACMRIAIAAGLDNAPDWCHPRLETYLGIFAFQQRQEGRATGQ